jgi:hypothetical protein
MNAMAVGAGSAADLVPLDADDLMERAARSTGLDDFGTGSWEEAYRRLVDSLNAEAQQHVVGRLQTRYDLLTQLRVRLQLIDAVATDPSITEEQVTAPVFVTGPARSGTSILHELLSQDPNLRGPLGWEMVQPFAPPGGADERAAATEASFDLWSDVSPEFAAVHELASTLPEECIWLMAPEFALGYWATNSNVPSFMMWRAMSDPLPGYEMHRAMLQVLQHGAGPTTWALKSPVHMGRLSTLFAVYPDARVIHTHRDPAKVVPSTVSTVANGRWLRSDAVDPKEVAATTGFGMTMMLDTTMAERTSGAVPAEQVTDLHYLDLLRDPVAAIGGAYERLGMPFTDELPARITGYLDARPQDKHGVHRYAASDFGLDADEIRQGAATYIEHYGVELEPTA